MPVPGSGPVPSRPDPGGAGPRRRAGRCSTGRRRGRRCPRPCGSGGRSRYGAPSRPWRRRSRRRCRPGGRGTATRRRRPRVAGRARPAVRRRVPGQPRPQPAGQPLAQQPPGLGTAIGYLRDDRRHKPAGRCDPVPRPPRRCPVSSRFPRHRRAARAAPEAPGPQQFRRGGVVAGRHHDRRVRARPGPGHRQPRRCGGEQLHDRRAPARTGPAAAAAAGSLQGRNVRYPGRRSPRRCVQR
jgi:hypothetical protein